MMSIATILFVILEHIRDIKDPEHPNTLEELNVVLQELITCDDENSLLTVTFTPTIPHCSSATLIGLCIKVRLIRSLPSRYKASFLFHFVAQFCHFLSFFCKASSLKMYRSQSCLLYTSPSPRD